MFCCSMKMVGGERGIEEEKGSFRRGLCMDRLHVLAIYSEREFQFGFVHFEVGIEMVLDY